MKHYILNLSDDKRDGLRDLVQRNRISKLKLLRAQILLKANEGMTDVEIADELGVGTATVERLRKRAVLDGLEAALVRKTPTKVSRPQMLDRLAEAHLVTLACSEPPDGASRWTPALLSERMVELNVVETASRSTIQRSLKNDIKPWTVKRFFIPPQHSAAFAAAMEDVLAVYRLPYDAARPVICFDETSKQLLEHTKRILLRSPAPNLPMALRGGPRRC